MHGRVKTRTTAEEQERKRKEKEKKSQLYRKGIERLFEKRKSRELDEEILVVSAQLLMANPDITTAWNIRRETLLHLHRSEEEKQQQLLDELRLTEQCLRANPKSYSCWHHRRWVLTQLPTPKWDQELALCNKYLDLDERNFHVWNYRRFVVEQSQVPAVEEFEYSTKKILVNFSNYSSWHYRSKLLPLIYPNPKGILPIQEEKHKEELGLVHNAAFTDPNDQSAWFYQRWLFGRTRHLLRIAAACVFPEMACVALTQSVKLCNETGMTLVLQADNETVPVTWTSTTGSQCSTVWMCSSVPPHKAVTEIVLYNNSTVVHSLELDRSSSRAEIVPRFRTGLSEGITSVLQDELDSCMQLLELEPDSKWTLLTTVFLMQAIDRCRYEADTFQMLDQLLQVDPQRSGYYTDLRSQYKMQYALDTHSMWDHKIDLSHLQLTALYYCQYLMCVHTVDLSHNKLTSRSLHQLHPLQCCQELKLDYNDIESVSGFPALMCLQTLSLEHNQINRPEDVKQLRVCRNLVNVKLGGNPAEEQLLMQAFFD